MLINDTIEIHRQSFLRGIGNGPYRYGSNAGAMGFIENMKAFHIYSVRRLAEAQSFGRGIDDGFRGVEEIHGICSTANRDIHQAAVTGDGRRVCLCFYASRHNDSAHTVLLLQTSG